MNIKTLLTLSLLMASFNAQSAVTACPSGWTKSADGLTCVLETKTTQTPNQVSNTAKPVCISGFTYSSTSMKCEQINNASTYNSNKTYTYLSALRFGPNPQEQCKTIFNTGSEVLAVYGNGSVYCPSGYKLLSNNTLLPKSVKDVTSNQHSAQLCHYTNENSATDCRILNEYYSINKPYLAYSYYPDPYQIGFCVKDVANSVEIESVFVYFFAQPACTSGKTTISSRWGGNPNVNELRTVSCTNSCGVDSPVVEATSSCPSGYKIVNILDRDLFLDYGCSLNSNTNPTSVNCSIKIWGWYNPTIKISCAKI